MPPGDETFGNAPAKGSEPVTPDPTSEKTGDQSKIEPATNAPTPAQIATNVVFDKIGCGEKPTLEEWKAAEFEEGAFHTLFDEPEPAAAPEVESLEQYVSKNFVPTLKAWTEAGYSADDYSKRFADKKATKLFLYTPTREQWEAAGHDRAEYDAMFGGAKPTFEGQTADTKPARPVRYFVDETRDAVRQVGGSTVIFRPGEVLTGYKLDLARIEGVQIREQ